LHEILSIYKIITEYLHKKDSILCFLWEGVGNSNETEEINPCKERAFLSFMINIWLKLIDWSGNIGCEKGNYYWYFVKKLKFDF